MKDKYPLLDKIQSPADLRKLNPGSLPVFCEELRQYLIETVSDCGGHFAAGLGVVEITTALHYIFNTPHDRLVWDVGHQSYPHKILTGRKEQLKTIRRKNGLAPFPARCESEYDTFGVGHSSTSISAALGMALALSRKQDARKVVAIIGDGGMTAGMAYEALNHLGATKANVLIILNDNEMSISPNVGAMTNYLTSITSSKLYTSIMKGGKKLLKPVPVIDKLAHRTKEHLKNIIVPGALFEELGVHYYGPVDGHNINLLIKTLERLAQLQGPRMLHIVTRKGKGYQPAERNPIAYHAVSNFNPKIGMSKKKPLIEAPTYSQVFGKWVCDMAEHDKRLVAITPAMREGSGLVEFEKRFPKRYFDVGIAEQHAVTLAAGFACEGMKPVVAIYSTFLQRAYDQLIHDVAIQNLPVLFAIDRAGLVGADGKTHTGNFDLSYLRCIPNMLIMTPADENMTREMLTTAFFQDLPTAIRYPRGTGTGVEITTGFNTIPIGKAAIIRKGQSCALLVFGSPLFAAQTVAEELDASLFDMRFVKPLDTETIITAAKEHSCLVTIEENTHLGGAGSAVNECLAAENLLVPMLNLGLPDIFPEHSTRDELLQEMELDAQSILQKIRSFIRN